MSRLGFVCCLLAAGTTLAQTKTSAELKQQWEAVQAKDSHSVTAPALACEYARSLKKPEEMTTAEATFKQALQLAQAGAKQNPTEPVWSDHVLAAYEGLAELAMRQHRWKLFAERRELAQTHLHTWRVGTLRQQLADLRLRQLEMTSLWMQMHHVAAATLGQAIADKYATLCDKHPTDTSVLFAAAEHLNNLAATLFRLSRTKDTTATLQQAIALLKKITVAEPKHEKAMLLHALCVNELALCARDSGRHMEADELYRRAIALAEELAQTHSNPRYRRTVARLWQNLTIMAAPHRTSATRDHTLAMAEEWRKRAASDVVEDEEDLATSYAAAGANQFGGTQLTVGDTRNYYTRLEQLANKHPEIPVYRVQQIQACALVLKEAVRGRDLSEALVILDEARKNIKQLHEAEPTIPLYEFLLVVLESEWITVAFCQGKSDDARQRHAQTMQAWQAFCKKYPKNVFLANTAAQTNLVAVSTATGLGEHALALAMYRHTLTIQQECAKQAPDEIYFRRNALNLLEGLASLQQNERDRDGIQQALVEAITGWEALVKDAPDVPDYACALATMRVHYADILDDYERYPEALAQCTTAAQAMQKWWQAKPEQPYFGTLFAHSCLRAAKTALNHNQPEQAVEWYTRVISAYDLLKQRDPKTQANYDSLAAAYKQRALLHNRLGKTQQYDADWKKADDVEREATRIETAKPK